MTVTPAQRSGGTEVSRHKEMDLQTRIKRFGYDPTLVNKILQSKPYVDQFWKKKCTKTMSPKFGYDSSAKPFDDRAQNR